MGRVFLFLGIIFLHTDCKKGDSPASVIEPILGEWRMTEYEIYDNDKKIWVSVNWDDKPVYTTVLWNGQILEGGLLPCCPPESLTINGSSFKITKNTDSKFYNPQCMYVNCYACPNLIIEQSGNEMTITHCGGSQRKYKREQPNKL
jgi:hypothetical protein